MESDVLIQEIVRLKGGQPDAERRMLSVISQANLFLVSENDPNTAGEDAVVVKSRVMTVDGHRTACLFSSEHTLTEWCVQHGCPPYAVPVHGGDLSFLMPVGTWILLDPGTPHEVELAPEQLALLNSDISYMQTAFSVVKDDDGGFASPRKAADDKGPSFTMQAPADVQVAPTSPAAQGPIKRRFSPRTHPTTLFQAPTIESKEIVVPDRKRSVTSSNLKKIIKSLPSGTE
jgi:hypothetical protein